MVQAPDIAGGARSSGHAKVAPMKTMLSLLILTGAAGLGGCIQLRAPDKPIEITLNVNIRQEIVVRLEKDVQDLIKKNPGIF